MPFRNIPLVNGEYYHIYNRGVAHQPIYLVKRDYERFLQCVAYYRFDKIPLKFSRLLQISRAERERLLLKVERNGNKAVDLIAFCLMPNHFHILLQQMVDGGISKFIKQLADSYTRYFNIKYKRVGPLFQGAFKAVRVETNEQLVHLSRYIHLNPLVSFVVKDKNFLSYPWSSLESFLGNHLGIVNPLPVLSSFPSARAYLDFVLDQAGYGKELGKIKHLILEK